MRTCSVGMAQCPEKSMDVNSLRIHWGSRHNMDGQPFKPLQMNVNELEHFACCAADCSYRCDRIMKYGFGLGQ